MVEKCPKGQVVKKYSLAIKSGLVKGNKWNGTE